MDQLIATIHSDEGLKIKRFLSRAYKIPQRDELPTWVVS